MNISKLLWVSGGVVIACLVDLVYMFWSRSSTGHAFHRAGWNSTGFGKGKFSVMGAANHMYGKGKY